MALRPEDEMTKQHIRDRIAEIELVRSDNEVAHIREDKLYYEFVEYVGRTDRGKLGELARELMEVRKLDFARWHA
jgi:hypothetical protein